MACFFLQPVVFGSWLPRIPEIQERLGLGPAGLALALLGMPAGLLLTMPFAGPIVARLGGRRVIAWAFPAFLGAMSLPAISVHPLMLFLALFLCGIIMSMVELGMNIVADEIEKRDRLAIMSRCHGFWSLGMAGGSVIGVGLANLAVPPHWAVLAVALIVLPAARLIPRALPPGERHDAPESETKSSGLFVPDWLLLCLCVVGLGSNLLEGATADWSAVYLTRVFAADVATAGLGYAVYAVMMAIGRFAGDWLRIKWGPVMLVRACYGLATVGVGLVVCSPNVAAALIGFALAGFGGSVGVPLAVSAAASAGGRPAAANVAMLTLVSLIGFLLGPPIIGFVAEHAGLRVGLGALLLPMLMLGAVCATALRRRSSLKQRGPLA